MCAPTGGMRQVTRTGGGRASRSQSSAICSSVMVEPLHIARGPVGSAIIAGGGGGEEGSPLAVALLERCFNLDWMKEASARKNAMAEEERQEAEASEVKGKSSSVLFHAYLNG